MSSIAIDAVLNVAVEAVSYLRREDRAINEEALLRTEQLQVSEKERFVFAAVMGWTTFTKARQINRAADRATEDMLHKLRTRSAIDDVVVLVRVKARCLIELKQRTVKIV